MEIALSDRDIKKALQNKTRVIEYKELNYYDDILTLLYPYDNLVILYTTKKGYGHWTCVIKHNNRIEFFDSHSYIPDDEFSFINKNFRNENGMESKVLLKLLNKAYDDGYIIHYNQYKLQEEKEGINTCGRWCLLRIYLRNLSIDEFASKIKNDKIAYELTKNIPE